MVMIEYELVSLLAARVTPPLGKLFRMSMLKVVHEAANFVGACFACRVVPPRISPVPVPMDCVQWVDLSALFACLRFWLFWPRAFDATPIVIDSLLLAALANTFLHVLTIGLVIELIPCLELSAWTSTLAAFTNILLG
jgi:hypothetical protein